MLAALGVCGALQGVPLLVYLEGCSQPLGPAELAQQEEWGRAAAARDPFQPGFDGFRPLPGYQQSGAPLPARGCTCSSALSCRTPQAGTRPHLSPPRNFFFLPAAPAQRAAGWRALVRLASRAAAVVTEDMPVPPDADALQGLAAALPPGVQLAAVDAACLLPMRLVRKCHEK
jgi:hypothetical protein